MADENKSKDVLVHADHVKVYFKGKDKKSGTVRAVDDISFDIFAGETFGVVGESGCGKSTLGRTLIRLIPATDGHVYLDGEDISGLKGKALKQMRKKAQIIFQVLHGLGERGLGDPQLFRGLAVVEGLGQL